VALPVFNESKYVDDILRAVRTCSEKILVVDDGSTDGTTEILAKHTDIQIVAHKTNRGYGQSLIEAFRFADGHNFDWMVTIDCDHQHEPSYIPGFCAEIEKDNADIISGTRYLRMIRAGSAPPPPERVAINRRITSILNNNLGIRLTDAFCGFKAYRISAVIRLALTEAGYGLPLQLWIRASRAGLRIREIPVPLIYHDPTRNFGGVLEDPQKRFAYYMEIIEKELGYNVGRKLAQNFHS
jgi:glycosyltransferase involved in cell wall biosynthesis